MKNDNNLQEFVMKSVMLNILEAFDTGKAIVAALTVGVLGYLANLFASLFRFVYWSSYFECYNLPIQYFESAINSSSSFYGFVVAIPISIIYVILQIRYNEMISRISQKIEKNNLRKRKPASIVNWMLKKSVYVMMPFVLLAIYFVLLIVIDGGNEFVLSIIISSMVMNILLTLLCGFINKKKISEKENAKEKQKGTFLIAGLVIGATVFVLSLYYVYLTGYFQKIILFDIPQVISVDNEETTQEYGKLLETDTSYICVPISYEEGKEYIMHVENSSYRVVPKDELITISESDAFAIYRDKGEGILFDFVGYNEGAYWKLLAGSILFTILIFYVEWYAFVKNKNGSM